MPTRLSEGVSSIISLPPTPAEASSAFCGSPTSFPVNFTDVIGKLFTHQPQITDCGLALPLGNAVTFSSLHCTSTILSGTTKLQPWEEAPFQVCFMLGILS